MPLDRIHLPDPVEAVAPTERLAVEVDACAERIASLLRPPLIVPDDGRPGHYQVVADRAMFLLQLRLLGTDANRPRTVAAIVLETGAYRLRTIAPAVEEALVPLVFDTLSVRKAASARRKLRQAALTLPRRVGTRAAVRRIVERPNADSDV